MKGALSTSHPRTGHQTGQTRTCHQPGYGSFSILGSEAVGLPRGSSPDLGFKQLLQLLPFLHRLSPQGWVEREHGTILSAIHWPRWSHPHINLHLTGPASPETLQDKMSNINPKIRHHKLGRPVSAQSSTHSPVGKKAERTTFPLPRSVNKFAYYECAERNLDYSCSLRLNIDNFICPVSGKIYNRAILAKQCLYSITESWEKGITLITVIMLSSREQLRWEITYSYQKSIHEISLILVI